MKLASATLLAVCATCAIAGEQKDTSEGSQGERRARAIQIVRGGSLPVQQGPASNFTGTVHIDGRFQRNEPARVGGATVTFQPGARTAWHTHPFGQTLIVTAGRGWVQYEGGAKAEIRPGDIVWIPPNVKHWHGATSTSAMTHIAITEALNGSLVTWMEHVSNPQYSASATSD